MSAESLNEDELIVKAEFIGRYDSDDFSISLLHENLRQVMDLEGYQPIEPRKTLLSSRTIRYMLKTRERDSTYFERFVDKIGPGESRPKPMDYHDQLRTTSDEIPFTIRFRFFPFKRDDQWEVRTSITIYPAVVKYHEQVGRRENYNAQNVVRRSKEFAETVAAEFGWAVFVEPHTPAEALRPTIPDQERTRLDKLEYGHKVISFADEGDQALKYGLNHSALASYIHAIEWAIITHLKDIADFDFIEEEGPDGGFNYKILVQELGKHSRIHQTTYENLSKHQTDRRIMAHHKSGSLDEHHVYSVKVTLQHLVDEAFHPSSDQTA